MHEGLIGDHVWQLLEPSSGDSGNETGPRNAQDSQATQSSPLHSIRRIQYIARVSGDKQSHVFVATILDVEKDLELRIAIVSWKQSQGPGASLWGFAP